MKAVSPRQVTRFVPSCDQALPIADQTTIIIKPLTVAEESILDDAQWRVDESGKRHFSFSLKMLMCLHLGLIGIENFKDEQGEFVSLEREEFADEFGVMRIKDETLARIPKTVRDEIALKIIASNTPTEEQRKN